MREREWNGLSILTKVKILFGQEKESCFNRLAKVAESDSPLECALFHGNREVDYPGYKRVIIERTEDNFKLVPSYGLNLKSQPVYFPEVKRAENRYCSCCGQLKDKPSDYANEFAFLLDGKVVFQGELRPSILLEEGVVPKVTVNISGVI